jgi:ACS family pantothenate transporter-like MFS transporter
MFGGIMMTAIYSGMNGSAGLPGWRWVFIIDGIITLPIAIFGFLYFPDLPATTKAPYFSAEERALAVSRLPIKSDETVKIDLTLFRRVLFTPNFWIFTLLWGIGGLIEGFSSFTCMLLWMKASGEFSVQQNNNYPLVISAIAIISTLTCAVVLDASQKRLPWAYLVCVLQIVTAIILLKWDTINNTARFAAYCKLLCGNFC